MCRRLSGLAPSERSKSLKGEPFSVRFTLATDRTIEAEARRTRRSKSAIVEALAEEAARTRRFPGIGFRGDDARRRPWVIGSGLDVWEIAQMVEDCGSVEQLVADSQLSERRVPLAFAYRESYPDEIAEAIAENRCSPQRVGGPLPDAGHDVLALAGDATIEALDDPLVLALAAAEQRILITRNSRDFAPLAREWAEAQRTHAGLILIWTLDHSQFAAIVAGVERLVAQRPEQEDWRDLVLAI